MVVPIDTDRRCGARCHARLMTQANRTETMADLATIREALAAGSQMYHEGMEALARLEVEIGRLRATIRINAMRWNPSVTNEEIERVIEGR
jgi:hypothetical protein